MKPIDKTNAAMKEFAESIQKINEPICAAKEALKCKPHEIEEERNSIALITMHLILIIFGIIGMIIIGMISLGLFDYFK